MGSSQWEFFHSSTKLGILKSCGDGLPVKTPTSAEGCDPSIYSLLSRNQLPIARNTLKSPFSSKMPEWPGVNAA